MTGSIVPAGATSIFLNVSSVGATANRIISIRPGDASGAATTSSLNVGAGMPTASPVQVSLPTACTMHITWDALGVAGPTTRILIDVLGYTAPPG